MNSLLWILKHYDVLKNNIQIPSAEDVVKVSEEVNDAVDDDISLDGISDDVVSVIPVAV